MVDLRNYAFISITDKKVKTEEYFINLYVNEGLKPESAMISTQRIRMILVANYKKADTNTVMDKKCQYLNIAEHYRILTFLKKFEDLFDSTLGTWNTKIVDLESNHIPKPV